MAVSFGGSESWGGNRNIKKPVAPKTTAPPPKKEPEPFDPSKIKRGGVDTRYQDFAAGVMNDVQNYAAYLLNSGNKAYNSFIQGQRNNAAGIVNNAQNISANFLNKNFNPAELIGKGAKAWVNNNPSGYPGAYTLAASKMAVENPPLASYLNSNFYTDPNSAYMDSRQYVDDKNFVLAQQAATDANYIDTITNNVTADVSDEEAPAPVTEQPGTVAPPQYDKGYVEQQPWYLNGDIGVFGQPVQPTEWTDPVTGQTYRVEVSPRGFGWYPAGFGKLEDVETPTDGGGNDWWNYTGWGGGGGGGYYSPVSYGNSNWIDRVLTNWRIRTR